VNVFYMMYKFQLIWLMHMRIAIVLVKLVFLLLESFKIEPRAVINFWCEIKKNSETFEMLKCAYGEECLSRTSVFE
jgi:hypothetical protein